jgi:glycosyltransferase involved in cell wall biosynthesis
VHVVIVNRHPIDVLGGSESQCDNIAAELHRRGELVTYLAPGAQANRTYPRDYRVLAVAENAGSIARAAIAARPDMLYWRLNKYHFRNAARAIGAAGIPIVFAISHINDTRMFAYYERPFAGVTQTLRAAKQALASAYNFGGYAYVSGVTSLNPEFLGRLPVKRQQFVPNSVDESGVAFSWPRPFVAWVANIKPAKRPEAFVDLARRLGDRGVDFLMIGAIQSVDYAWVEDVPDVPNFHYLGSKSIAEVNGVLEHAMVLAHTCLPEGFGNIFIQAWLAGTPTVSLGFDPAGFITANDLGGMAGNDPALFAAQVARLIDDPDLRAVVGERARVFARANFSIKQTVDVLQEFFADVLRNGIKEPGANQCPL